MYCPKCGKELINIAWTTTSELVCVITFMPGVTDLRREMEAPDLKAYFVVCYKCRVLMLYWKYHAHSFVEVAKLDATFAKLLASALIAERMENS